MYSFKKLLVTGLILAASVSANLCVSSLSAMNRTIFLSTKQKKKGEAKIIIARANDMGLLKNTVCAGCLKKIKTNQDGALEYLHSEEEEHLNVIENDPLLVQIPCGHIIHMDCIHELITQGKHRCPLCRKPLISAYLKLVKDGYLKIEPNSKINGLPICLTNSFYCGFITPEIADAHFVEIAKAIIEIGFSNEDKYVISQSILLFERLIAKDFIKIDDLNFEDMKNTVIACLLSKDDELMGSALFALTTLLELDFISVDDPRLDEIINQIINGASSEISSSRSNGLCALITLLDNDFIKEVDQRIEEIKRIAIDAASSENEFVKNNAYHCLSQLIKSGFIKYEDQILEDIKNTAISNLSSKNDSLIGNSLLILGEWLKIAFFKSYDQNINSIKNAAITFSSHKNEEIKVPAFFILLFLLQNDFFENSSQKNLVAEITQKGLTEIIRTIRDFLTTHKDPNNSAKRKILRCLDDLFGFSVKNINQAREEVENIASNENILEETRQELRKLLEKYSKF